MPFTSGLKPAVILAWFGLNVCLTSLLVVGLTTAKASDEVRKVSNRNLLLSIDRGEKSPVSLTEYMNATGVLTRTPISAAAFNTAMLYRLKAIDRDGPVDARAKQRYLNVASLLGWRYTPLLQNRLYLAAIYNDTSSLINVLDALMRRKQLTEQATSVLNVLEQDSRGRDALVRTLSSSPPWRLFYFQNPNVVDVGLKTVDARYRLVKAMIDRGVVAPSREELLPTSRLLAEHGRAAEAYQLWRQTLFQSASLNSLVYDGDFRVLQQVEQSSSLALMPFEWEDRNTPALSKRFGSANDRRYLDIEVPLGFSNVLIQQRLNLAKPQGKLTLHLSESVPHSSVEGGLGFDLDCSGVSEAFVPVERRSGSSAKSTLIAQANCIYPMLRVKYNPGLVDQQSAVSMEMNQTKTVRLPELSLSIN